MTPSQPPFDAPGQPPVPPPPAVPPSAVPLQSSEPPISGPPAYGYPLPAPGHGYPQPGAVPPPVGYGYPAGPPPTVGQPLVTLGDIAVTSTAIVTPAGPIPLRGAVWTATDLSRTEERIAPAGIVLAIIFFLFCLIGLLFLLMKERRTVGHVQITVSGGGRYHATSVPVSSPQQVMDLMNRVNYARGLSM